MQLLSTVEADEWLAARRIRVDREGGRSLLQFVGCVSCSVYETTIVEDAQAAAGVAEELLLIKDDRRSDYLVLIYDWDHEPALLCILDQLRSASGVTSSLQSEQRVLGSSNLDELKQGYGINKSIRDKPGHLFAAEELSGLLALFAFILICGWGCYVVPAHGQYLLRCDHDRYCTCVFRGAEYEQAFLPHITPMQFVRIDTRRHCVPGEVAPP